jgi:hypothetical protein
VRKLCIQCKQKLEVRLLVDGYENGYLLSSLHRVEFYFCDNPECKELGLVTVAYEDGEELL